ncbi:MAG: 16S rRNA (guanine(966)-N(2))-methyltransferase RsmD [Proteobacteria bacterium]|nr:16S rRNA (guanine(966)-N(2))-methyltransferase RsmD [Pseudomonadota bacterium]MDE3208793.1 16S rRNA (guanine(966)-N(2))-methyltransferase RsmD [Pseudomonadota bacterium]
MPKNSRAKNKSHINQVRIIGGIWRSRLLKFPDLPGLRPTPQRSRETLFNWLGQTLDGTSCLDLFAGSGALGFEALSRGASSVVMVENAAQARTFLLENARTLGAGSRLRVIFQDATEFLRASQEQFDLIFVDPPFGLGLIPDLLPGLLGQVKAGGHVYVESELDLFELPEGFRLKKKTKAGMACHALLEVIKNI